METALYKQPMCNSANALYIYNSDFFHDVNGYLSFSKHFSHQKSGRIGARFNRSPTKC